MKATKMGRQQFNFNKYLKYVNFWLNSKKKRILTLDEEDTLYARLDTVAREYNPDAEQYDLMTVLAITAAKATMDMRPDIEQEELLNRISKVAKKKK